MKKYKFIIVLIASFAFVGCHKVDIAPHECNSDNEDRVENNDDDSEFNEKGINPNGSGDFDRGGSGGGITDPNHDEDEDRKTMRK
jgi:hypothetical protein